MRATWAAQAGGTPLEAAPEHGVFALVMRVQPGGEHRQVVTDEVGLLRVGVGDPADQPGALAEPGPEHPMDLGHAAGVADLDGARCGSGAAIGVIAAGG